MYHHTLTFETRDAKLFAITWITTNLDAYQEEEEEEEEGKKRYTHHFSTNDSIQQREQDYLLDETNPLSHNFNTFQR